MVRAAEGELASLIDAKRNLEASVQVERDACGVLRGQLEESKGKQGRLHNEVRTLKTELQRYNESSKKHEEEILQLRKSISDVSTERR